MSLSLLRAQRFAQISDRQATSVHRFMEDFCGPHGLEIYHQKDLAFNNAATGRRRPISRSAFWNMAPRSRCRWVTASTITPSTCPCAARRR